jgi:hypothetical protein
LRRTIERDQANLAKERSGSTSTAARSRSSQVYPKTTSARCKRIEASAPRVDKHALLKKIKALGGGWKLTDET